MKNKIVYFFSTFFSENHSNLTLLSYFILILFALIIVATINLYASKKYIGSYAEEQNVKRKTFDFLCFVILLSTLFCVFTRMVNESFNDVAKKDLDSDVLTYSQIKNYKLNSTGFINGTFYFLNNDKNLKFNLDKNLKLIPETDSAKFLIEADEQLKKQNIKLNPLKINRFGDYKYTGYNNVTGDKLEITKENDKILIIEK